MTIFIGDDWAEDHHDICLMGESGEVMASRRIPEGIAGIARLHDLIASHARSPNEIIVGIETDHGPWVDALLASGYRIYAPNPRAVKRYRELHHLSGSKSDKADAKSLADLVRTDRHNFTPVTSDSVECQAIKVMARQLQNLVWLRTAQTNVLRASLLQYYPAALATFKELAGRDCLAVLQRAPTPDQGNRLSKPSIRAALKAAGRQRGLDTRVAQIHQDLRAPQLHVPAELTHAYGASVTAIVTLLISLNEQISTLEATLEPHFEQHPDAAIYLSMPGIGHIIGARMLGEFGDVSDRYATAKSRRNYAGTSPITIASGKQRAVLARWIRNKRLADATTRWAYSALTASPGARRYYDTQRASKHDHEQALRALSNKLVGMLHGCLTHRVLYNEHIAWDHPNDQPLNTAA